MSAAAGSKRIGASTTFTAVSPELAEIVRGESRGEAGLPISRHLQIIEGRRAQETESFLRACAVRLRLEGGV